MFFYFFFLFVSTGFDQNFLIIMKNVANVLTAVETGAMEWSILVRVSRKGWQDEQNCIYAVNAMLRLGFLDIMM